jgi:spermidine synthase
MNSPNRAGVGFVLMLLFAISGFAGLIYESIWTQYLGLFLGHAAYAQSFVLMLFMGGMALGAWLVSRRSESFRRPLAAYAAIEFFVGLLAIGFDPLYHALTGFAYSHLFPLVGAGIGLDLTRYAVAILLIGCQCILLGMTFPLMSAGYLRFAPDSGGQVLASLYFSNSFGAALGALAATFLLLPSVGLPGTVMTGGLLSILVAFAIWPLARDASVPKAEEHPAHGDAIAPIFILFAAALTGATSFVYEITWVRMLSQALGSTLHAFELMLAAFITGIAIGGLWLRRRADRWPNALFAAGWAQVLMGIAALGSLFVYGRAFDWVAALMHGLGRTEQGYTLFNFATGLISLAVMFPAAFFAGMTLPLLTLALLRRGGGERAIGRTYAANTVGAIIGVLLTVHLLMPLLGVRIGLWLAALADLLLGVYLLARGGDQAAPLRARRHAGVALAVSLVAAVASVALTRIDPLVLASSVYRAGEASLPKGTQMISYRDGKTATIAMYQMPGGVKHRAIATNGKIDASVIVGTESQPTMDEYTMTFAAALPLALNPRPSRVGVIGFGSGMTAHAFLGSDRVERLDVVEIEPYMVEAAKHFEGSVERAYTDPRAHIVIDDAKAFLSGTPHRYDVIISEPSNPWVSGVAALFTEEFYDFVPQHLNEDGIFLQWLQLYEINPELVASVLKAMLPRFADVKAYMANQTDMLLVASVKRPLPPLAEINEVAPRLGREMQRLGMRSSADFADYFLMDKTGLTALTHMTNLPANSDLFPLLQLKAPKARFMNSEALAIANLQRAPWPLSEVVTGQQPLAVTHESSTEATSVPRILMNRIARALRSGLLSDSEPKSSVAGAAELFVRYEFMREAARSCAIDRVAGSWLEASSAIAGATIPYLRAEDLEGVWIHPGWLGNCVPSDPRIEHALALYAALSARDWQTVRSIGKSLLRDGEIQGSPAFRTWVLGATEVAALALHDLEGIAEIERDHGADIRSYVFERQWMATLAFLTRNSSNAASAAMP